ncbi:MAG: hypothetical protein WCT77_01560 [Bacteroidota bacterium]|jgi:hypothetical protein
MKNIDTLSSIEGRSLLNEIFQELRYQKQMSAFSTLLLCWRICINEREIFRYVKKEVTVLHPLGLFSGTGLWLEEIVNRYYYSTFNAFVYFGAAVLLLLIGIRRFNDNISNDVVIAGIAFEALMLILLFVIMLFTPNDDVLKYQTNGKDEDNPGGELLLEIGEISRDLAGAVVQLEKFDSSMQEMVKQQTALIQFLKNVSENFGQAVAPNPRMLEAMNELNSSLAVLKNTVDSLNSSAETLKKEEIEFAVRHELEKILANKISDKI